MCGATATRATLFRYIVAVADLPADELTEKVLAAAPEVEDAIMTIAEQLEAKGRAKGEAKGRQDLLLRQLTLKFGPPSDMTRTRVAQASDEDLTRWAERILTATSLDDMFARPDA